LLKKKGGRKREKKVMLYNLDVQEEFGIFREGPEFIRDMTFQFISEITDLVH
jgi:hypothetical protein